MSTQTQISSRLKESGEWRKVPLGEVCNIINGKNQKKVVNPTGKYPIYGSAGVMGYADDFLVEPGATIVGRKGTINKPIYVSNRFWNVDTAFGFSPDATRLSGKFLYYFCLGFNFHSLDKSTTIPSLAKSDLLKIEIPLPPLSIQVFIVSKIEELFSELDKGIESLKLAQQQLKVYRQSVLKWAFEGKLTNENEYVKEGELPEGWKLKTISDVCEMKAGNFIKASEIEDHFKEGLYACYGGNGIRGYVKSYTHEGIFPLVGRQGALCGNVHMVNGKFHATEHAVVVSAKENIEVRWLYYKLIFMRLNQYSSGAAQPGLSVNKLLPIKLFTPPKEEQIQIVTEIEARFSQIDELVENINQSLQQAEAMRQSVLKRAFEGSLLKSGKDINNS